MGVHDAVRMSVDGKRVDIDRGTVEDRLAPHLQTECLVFDDLCGNLFHRLFCRPLRLLRRHGASRWSSKRSQVVSQVGPNVQVLRWRQPRSGWIPCTITVTFVEGSSL